MSPTTNTIATDEGRQQSRTDARHENFDAQKENEVVAKKSQKTQEKLMNLQMSLDKRMKRIASPHEKKEHYKGHEVNVFGSVLGQIDPMSTRLA